MGVTSRKVLEFRSSEVAFGIDETVYYMLLVASEVPKGRKLKCSKDHNMLVLVAKSMGKVQTQYCTSVCNCHARLLCCHIKGAVGL